MRLNLFKFTVEGGSQGNGIVVVVAGTTAAAGKLARAHLEEVNTVRFEEHRQNELFLANTPPVISPFTFPAVLHFDAGEV